MRDWTDRDLIGPDGVNRGYPNNVSRRTVEDMEARIRERFGEAEVLRTREAVGNRPLFGQRAMAIYGDEYRDPAPEPEQSRAEFEREMDERDPEWREAAYPDGDLDE